MYLPKKPILFSLENVKIITPNDTVYFNDKINERISYFEKNTTVELVKNDSIQVYLIIKYKKRNSGTKVLKTKHSFVYHGKKMRGLSHWKSDLPFFMKLTGYGSRWETVSRGGIWTSSSTSSAYARLPRKQGLIILACNETLYF